MARTFHHRLRHLFTGDRLGAVFLVAAVAVVLAIAAQAFSLVRSQELLAIQVLEGHAETVGWSVSQGLRTESARVAECLFHPLHETPMHANLSAVPPASVVRDACRCGLCHGAPTTAFRFGPGAEVEFTGPAAPSPEFVGDLRNLLYRYRQAQRPLNRSEYVMAGEIEGKPFLLFVSRQTVRRQPVQYVVPFDSVSAAPLFQKLLRNPTLLPPSAVLGALDSTQFRFEAVLPSGEVLFASRTDDDHRAVGSHPLIAGSSGLVGRVRITPAGAEALAPSNEFRARAVNLGVMLAVSLVLVVLAVRYLRRERELARVRADFISSVSHELRTPLALQRIFLDMLALGRVRTETERSWAIKAIDRESLRLQHLVDNVLQFSRAEREQLRINPVERDLAEVVSGAVASVEPLAHQHDAVLDTSGDPGLVVAVDEPALYRAIANGVENAMKYGPRGQTIRVRCTSEGAVAVITIDDEGHGVPPSEREAIFEPFRRGSDAGASATGGSGIGLAVVRQIMDLHGGSATMVDAPGGGARLRLELPLLRQEAALRGGAVDPLGSTQSA